MKVTRLIKMVLEVGCQSMLVGMMRSEGLVDQGRDPLCRVNALSTWLSVIDDEDITKVVLTTAIDDLE